MYYLGKDYTDQYLAKVCPKDPTLLQKAPVLLCAWWNLPCKAARAARPQEQPEEQRENSSRAEEQQRPSHEQPPKNSSMANAIGVSDKVLQDAYKIGKNITSTVGKGLKTAYKQTAKFASMLRLQ